MKKKRIGNDIRVIWEIFENDLPFALEGKSVKLYLKESLLRHEITDFSVKENSIEWIYYGKDQKMTGVKSLELVINEGESGMITTDACRFVELVACSCQESGSDENGVTTETISLKSTISVENGGASIVVDTELSETSTNAIANSTVTQELKKKVNKTDLATINGQRIDEGGNIEIAGGGGGQVVADAVLYTEQELTEEQKSQARTNIGVDDAIESAIAELPEPESSVFEAIYGETTYDELVAAVNAKKHVICFYNSKVYNMCNYQENMDIFFSCVTSAVFTIQCLVSGKWSESRYSYERSDLKVTSLSDKSTDAQYPSAKAVYDFVNNSKDVFEAEFNVTTYAEVKAAYDSGKTVICRYSVYITRLTQITATNAIFTATIDHTIVRLMCYTTTKVWTATNFNTAPKLEVLNNGNVRVTIAGKSQELMPATPSGDPMHYLYVSAGAEYNDTGEDIIRTGMYGDTITWKADHWWLNELGDITNEEIRTIYTCWKKTMDWGAYSQLNNNASTRTNFPFLGLPAIGFFGQTKTGSSQVFQSNRTIVKASVFWPEALYGYHTLLEMFAYCYSLETIIGVLGAASYGGTEGMFRLCYALKDVQITHLKQTISFVSSSKLSNASILYMIQNEAATSAITITLHADAYARAMADSEITAALEAHPNVSLASA